MTNRFLPAVVLALGLIALGFGGNEAAACSTRNPAALAQALRLNAGLPWLGGPGTGPGNLPRPGFTTPNWPPVTPVPWWRPTTGNTPSTRPPRPSITPSPAPIPEPTTLAVLVAGGAGVVLHRTRARRRGR